MTERDDLLADTRATPRITCPLCGDTFDPYDGYRTDPWFYAKVNAIARMERAEPIHVISTGKYTIPVPDELLGLE